MACMNGARPETLGHGLADDGTTSNVQILDCSILTQDTYASIWPSDGALVRLC